MWVQFQQRVIALVSVISLNWVVSGDWPVGDHEYIW